MKDLVITCLLRAHTTIRSNRLVLWFPILFATTAGVFYLLFTILLMPQLLDTAQGDTLVLVQEIMALAPERIISLAVVGLMLYLIMAAGTLGLQARAVRKETLETGDYFRSAKRFFLPMLGGQALSSLAYVLPILLLTVVFRTGSLYPTLIGQDITVEEMVAILASLGIFPILAIFLFSTLSILFAMWPKVLVLQQISLLRALVAGFRFVQANFLPIAILLGGSWIFAGFIRILLEGSLPGYLLQLALGFTIRSYAAIAMMHLYVIKTTQY